METNASKIVKKCPFSDRPCNSSCAFWRENATGDPDNYSLRCQPIFYLSASLAMISLIRKEITNLDSLRHLEELENLNL